VFVLYYGITRWLSDSLRVNDERVAGMTGAQWMCLVLIPAGVWILWKVRPRLAALEAAEGGDGAISAADAAAGDAEVAVDADADVQDDDATADGASDTRVDADDAAVEDSDGAADPAAADGGATVRPAER
jgi:hypothetical protein